MNLLKAPFLSIVFLSTFWGTAWAQHSHDQHGPAGHGHFRDAKKWIERFEDPARDAWQKPDAVVESLKLKPGMNVADVGAASGYFTRRLASQVMPGGYALAVDIESSFFPYVLERAHSEGQFNLFTVQSLPDDPRLPDESLDVVLIVNTLHHISERPTYYDKLRKSLRSGGRVVVVDFQKDVEIPVGPSREMRLSRESVEEEFRSAGFTVESDTELLPYQYIITATKR